MSGKKSPALMLIFSSQSKITDNKGVYSWNKMWSLKSLAMLKCERRTSLHALQYKWQSCFVDVLFLLF